MQAIGSPQRALAAYEQTLTLYSDTGDRGNQATTRFNITMIHRANGDLDAAVTELEQVVDLDRQVDHPDLASDTAALEQLRQKQARNRSRTQP